MGISPEFGILLGRSGKSHGGDWTLGGSERSLLHLEVSGVGSGGAVRGSHHVHPYQKQKNEL